MNFNRDLLSVTAFFSFLVHAVIILGVSFSLPDIASLENTDNTLDVVLVNKANNEEPLEAQTISSNNNSGGGLSELEATSPIPYEMVTPSPVESIKLTAEQQLTSTIAKDKLISQNKADVKIVDHSSKESKLAQKKDKTGKNQISTKSDRQLERERKIAIMNKRWQEYQKRPKKEYFSPTSKEHQAAQYLDQWRKKIEVVGNANYPIQAKAKNIYGTLILTVEINRNGTIASIIVNNPSKHKLLNDAAVRFVRDASPFASFPDEIDPTTDILVITRAFHFLDSHRLSSSATSNQKQPLK